ncbi:hypothetical protein QF027_003206 [Streptomyces canus]|nr:hypothetical protein [Streptomyces canus]
MLVEIQSVAGIPTDVEGADSTITSFCQSS